MSGFPHVMMLESQLKLLMVEDRLRRMRMSLEGGTVRYSTDHTQDEDIQEMIRLFCTGEANTVEVLGTANQQFIDAIVNGLTVAGFTVEKTQDNAKDTVYIRNRPEDPAVVEEVKKIVYEIIEEEWKRKFEDKLGALGVKK
jgi:DNA-binding FadR family transcriptional regulator